MNRKQALKLLKAELPSQRLSAVRFLSRNPCPEILQDLRNARSRETHPTAKRALDNCILTIEQTQPPKGQKPEPFSDVPRDIVKEIEEKARHEFAGLVIHELNKTVGLVASAAQRDIKDFENSRTRFFLERLKKDLFSLEQLRSASEIPRLSEFDLAMLIREVIETEKGLTPVKIECRGRTPFPIFSDSGLIKLAFGNGLKNSIEAITQQGDFDKPIVVNWGKNQKGYWIIIKDYGPGLSFHEKDLFKLNTTSKDGHIGYGLSIAKRAIQNLNGSIMIRPREDVGVHFEINWS